VTALPCQIGVAAGGLPSGSVRIDEGHPGTHGGSRKMVARIAISDPLPAFCRGIAAILREAGFDAEAPDDVFAWLRDEQAKLIFLSVLTPQDWVTLEEMAEGNPDAVIIALLDDMSVPSHVRALTAGAVAALPRDAAPPLIRQVFEVILSGRSLLPIAVLRSLVRKSAEPDIDKPSPREREWLRDLASGMTINQLASKAGYSERMMFRLLRDLYSRFGARTKVEALMLARENGWL
jgi:DNA-binding NarL/FixJ family response regulator